MPKEIGREKERLRVRIRHKQGNPSRSHESVASKSELYNVWRKMLVVVVGWV